MDGSVYGIDGYLRLDDDIALSRALVAGDDDGEVGLGGGDFVLCEEAADDGEAVAEEVGGVVGGDMHG